MDARMFEWIIFAPLIIGLLLISWWATTKSENRLNDPTDDRAVYLDQLPAKLALFAHGIYKVTIFRQSGNIHAEQIVTGTAATHRWPQAIGLQLLLIIIGTVLAAAIRMEDAARWRIAQTYCHIQRLDG